MPEARKKQPLGEDGTDAVANINDASSQFTMGWDDGNNDISASSPLTTAAVRAPRQYPMPKVTTSSEWHTKRPMGCRRGKRTKAPTTTSALPLAVQMLLTPYPKMVWQFGELGNNQNTKKDDGDNNTDPKNRRLERMAG